MAARTSFAVNDRESTPVSHTFSPHGDGKDNTSVRFIEPGPTSIANTTYNVGWRETLTRNKVSIVLSVPKVVTETINGVDSTKVQHRNWVKIECDFDRNATLQERKNAVGMLVNSLAPGVAVIDSTVTGLESIW
jgi:hypothetical protein